MKTWMLYLIQILFMLIWAFGMIVLMLGLRPIEIMFFVCLTYWVIGCSINEYITHKIEDNQKQIKQKGSDEETTKEYDYKKETKEN